MDEMSYEEVLQQVGCLLTRNIGYSMLPLLRQNQDSIMIERCDPYHLAKYDVIMFKRVGDRKGKYVLHRILGCRPDGTYWVVGDNCTSGEIVKPEQILGRMSAVGRNGKTFKTDKNTSATYASGVLRGRYGSPFSDCSMLFPGFVRKLAGRLRSE